MANITLAIPDSLHEKIRDYSEIRWSEVIRKIIEKRISDMELMDDIVNKSKFASEHVDEIGVKIKVGIARKHGLK